MDLSLVQVTMLDMQIMSQIDITLFCRSMLSIIIIHTLYLLKKSNFGHKITEHYSVDLCWV